MKKILFTIAVFNEEKRIVSVIESIKAFASEIVLLDAGCTDRTIEFARGAWGDVRVVKVTSDMFDVRERVSALVKSFKRDISEEWLLPMNASEEMPLELGIHLVRLINRSPKLCGISFYRQSYTFGAKTHNRKFYYILTSLIGRSNIRMFKLKAWDSDSSSIHSEFPLLSAYKPFTKWILPINGRFLKHIRVGTLRDFELKHSKYSDQEALQLHQKGIKGGFFSLLRIVFPSLIYFPFQFFNSKNAGIVGIYHVIYKFQVWAKLSEYDQLKNDK